MILNKLLLKSFGKFQNREIVLKEGINVVYGENESGKSTMHTFLRAMFFGLRRMRGRLPGQTLTPVINHGERTPGMRGFSGLPAERNDFGWREIFLYPSPRQHFSARRMGNFCLLQMGIWICCWAIYQRQCFKTRCLFPRQKAGPRKAYIRNSETIWQIFREPEISVLTWKAQRKF